MIGKEETDYKIAQEMRRRLTHYPSIVTLYYNRLIKEGKTYQSTSVYIKIVMHFIDFLFSSNIPSDFYRRISYVEITGFLDTLASDSTKATNWSALNSFFQFLVPKYIGTNPMENISRPMVNKQKKSAFLSVEETRQILRNVDLLANEKMRNRDKCILMLGFCCGLKSSDIVQANLSDIDFKRSIIRLYIKEYDAVDIPLSTSVRECLALWINDRKKYFDVPNDALFVSQIKKRISDDTLNILLKRYAVGIEKKVTTRVMRNTCVVTLYKETKNLALCAKLLGQPNISVAQRYIEQILSESDVEEAINIVDDVLNNKNNAVENIINIPPLAMKIIQKADVAELGFSTQLEHFLKREDISTIGELCTWHKEELAEIPYITVQDIDDIQKKLEEVGLCLCTKKLEFPQKNDEWFSNIKWDKSCIMCQRETDGVCKERSCAEENYDPWGDPLPAFLWHPGGNDSERYLAKKLRQKASSS